MLQASIMALHEFDFHYSLFHGIVWERGAKEKCRKNTQIDNNIIFVRCGLSFLIERFEKQQKKNVHCIF